MADVIKGSIGKEDFQLQTNTNAPEQFQRLNSVGGTQNLYKMPDIWTGMGAINLDKITAKQFDSIVTKSPWIDITHPDFGAKTTYTDNSTPIQDALTSGLPVLIPPGTFSYSTGLTLYPSNSHLFGMNHNSKLKYTGSGNAMSLASGGDGVTLSNFQLYSETGAIGIYIDESIQVRINNLFMDGNNTGFTDSQIEVEGGAVNNSHSIVFFENKILRGAGHGIRFKSVVGPAGITILGNRIQANQGIGVYSPDDAATVLQILSNVIEGNTAGLIEITYPFTCAIIGNHFEHTGAIDDSPIILGGYGGNTTLGRIYGMDFLNNNISGNNADYCISMNSGTAVTFQGNYITGYATASYIKTGTFGKSTLGPNQANDQYGIQTTGTQFQPQFAFAASDTTPSVSDGNFFVTLNAAPTTITMFDNGSLGQSIKIVFGDANTTIDFTGTNLKGNVGADWTPANGDFMDCTFDGVNWYCAVHDCTA